ncbi:MAG: chemotaxis protein CheW [Ancalomicrobiaceae bacterium]|nr:chemotaxis protein CheW [Ancalomicrobiaceae bacterium]
MSAVAQSLETLEAEFAPDRKPKPATVVTAATDARQFVIFHIQGERFAVSLSEVQEIIRVPGIVQVPFSPPSLEGLANLRGNVLPVINLRKAFGFPLILHDDATRVVVLDHGRPIGLIVDRMANVVTVDAERIESADSIRATIDSDFLTGMIKDADGRSMVMILDTEQIVRREFKDIFNREAGAVGDRTIAAQGERARQLEVPADEDQLVSFEVAGQEYAFPIERVQEIVQLPETVTGIPNVAGHVLGVITLRNRLLPLVSLRGLFSLPAIALTEANKVVVVSLGPGATQSVGVVMDSVKEVLRVSRSLVEPMPDLLNGGGTLSDITAICRLQDGRRLVSVLSAEKMFNRVDLEKLAQADEDGMAELQSGASAPATSDSGDEEQFVVFRLMGEEYGVPIDAVQEIVRVPAELTRIPNTPDFIEGVINLRGVVLPVIDQRRRFRLDAAERTDRQRIMVLTVRGVQTGFIVDFVSEVRRIPAAAIGPAPNLSDEQARIVRRVANLETEKRMILLLDVLQLLNVGEIEAASRSSLAH